MIAPTERLSPARAAAGVVAAIALVVLAGLPGPARSVGQPVPGAGPGEPSAVELALATVATEGPRSAGAGPDALIDRITGAAGPWPARPVAAAALGTTVANAPSGSWSEPLAIYPGGCERGPGGLAEVHRTSADPRRFAWGWRTCGPLPATASAPTVVFLLHAAGSAPTAAATYLVVQYPDGRAVAFATGGPGGSAWVERRGTVVGQVRRHADAVEGQLSFDRAYVDLPGVYRLEVVSIDAEGRIGVLPPPGDPGELWHPRRCTAVAPTRPPVSDGRSRPRATADGWVAAAIGVPDPAAGGVLPVAVVDTGIAAAPALAPHLLRGHDAVTGRAIPAGRDSAHGSHGTAVASLIAARPTPGAHEVTAIAAGAPLLPVRVTGSDGCVSSGSLVAALDALVRDGRARVVNLSLGGAPTPELDAALDRAAAAGLILVAATGNDADLAPGRPSYPAAHPQVIGVGATTADGRRAPYSQLAGADIHAPGGSLACLRHRRCEPGSDLVALDRDGRPQLVAGTSYAAALVSGAVARWLADHPDASSAEVRDALVRSGRPLEPDGAGPAGVALDLVRLLDEPGRPVVGEPGA